MVENLFNMRKALGLFSSREREKIERQGWGKKKGRKEENKSHLPGELILVIVKNSPHY